MCCEVYQFPRPECGYYKPVTEIHSSMKTQHLALLWTVLTAVTFAQTKRASSVGHGSVHEYERVPFDLGQTQLPSHFAGHNVEAIYKALRTIPPKSEYETSAAYENPFRGSTFESPLWLCSS